MVSYSKGGTIASTTNIKIISLNLSSDSNTLAYQSQTLQLNRVQHFSQTDMNAPAYQRQTLQAIFLEHSRCKKKFTTRILEKKISANIFLSKLWEAGAVFTTLHFIPNLRMLAISQSVCPWQTFPPYCNVTFQLNGPLKKIKCCEYGPCKCYSQSFIKITCDKN